MYLKLARSAVEHYVATSESLPLPSLVPQELMRQRACYVSLFENPGKRLRSFYGEPLPRQRTLAEEIIMNASRAAGGYVRRVDLPYLIYTVAVLDPLQRISDAAHLNPQLYGLYVRSEQNKTAVLLPGRVGIETPEDQIATAIREAGIDVRREIPLLYRFKVTYYE